MSITRSIKERTMASKFRTTSVKVKDQYGQTHNVIKMTPIVDVRFANGSMGATAGPSKYVLEGRQLQEMKDGRLSRADGSITYTLV